MATATRPERAPTPLSPTEHSRLRRLRLIVWATPLLASAIYAAAFAATYHFGTIAWGTFLAAWLQVLQYVTAFTAGCIPAVAVVRLHPVERGKWLRACVAFVIGFALAWIATVLFGFLLLIALFAITGRPL